MNPVSRIPFTVPLVDTVRPGAAGGGEGVETVEIKWLEKLEMTSLHGNTVMTTFPQPW